MTEVGDTVPLSRTEYNDLLKRAARAEEHIKKFLVQIETLEANAQSSSSAKPATTSPTSEKQGAAGDDVKLFIIETLKTQDPVGSQFLAQQKGVDLQIIVGAIKALEAKFQVESTSETKEQMCLSKEGKNVLAKGMSPEMEIYNAIPDGGISREELLKNFDKSYVKAGWGNVMKLRLAKLDKKSGMVTKTATNPEDEVVRLLTNISKGDDILAKDFKALKRRKMVEKKKVTLYTVTKGKNFGMDTNVLSNVTYEDVLKYTDPETGEWTGPAVREMNLQAKASLPPLGVLHPLGKIRTSFRQILLEMGFQEMRTNRYVESCFWNFDSLFQPQAHPARDAHDTFFLSRPETKQLPKSFSKYFQEVKQTHEDGGKTGSRGHQVPWKASEAEKNILRTHTTAISARTLYQLAQQRPFKPGKYFSIDRVFRNETVDATHLAEFHQIEGFVIGKGLHLGHLIGTIAEFFKKIGIPDVKFKPAYNPYTEPSMEIFGRKPGKETWMEVGNSGVFRPEMLQPMGFPEDVTVIAWGLGLERMTMQKYKLSNIRELFGPGVNLSMVRSTPIPYHVV